MRRLRVVDSKADAQPAASVGGGHMKVAFATQDLHTLDAHFAGARNFAVYEVEPDGYRFLEAVRFDSSSAQDGNHAEDGHDRLEARISSIDGCSLLFVIAIGGPAAARVVAHRIHPVKVPKPEPITDVLERLKTMLSGSPPPWLRKAMRQHDDQVPSFVDEEDDE